VRPHGRCDPDPVALRCLIVDDNLAFLDAARDLLERQGLAVVGTASSGDDARRSVAGLRPDLTLVDVELGEESGIELAGVLAALHPDGRVVLISTYAERDLDELVAESPAIGFLSKSDLSRAALDALSERRGR
jgi:DNA-binding NarL/FixJ family response regulator